VVAFVASLAIGIIQTFSVALDYSMLDLLARLGAAPARGTLLFEFAKLSIAQAAPVIPFLLMVLMLIFRPKGLMGTRAD